MKTTIDIADDLLVQAKKVAHDEAITLKTLMEEGLHLALQRRESSHLHPFEPHVVGGTTPPPDVSWDAMREGLYGNEGDWALKNR